MTSPTETSYPKPFIPVGLCQCGCGAQTKLAPANDSRYGIKKGDPQKFLQGHSRMRCWVPAKPVPNKYPYGECQCGCGGKTKIAKNTDKGWGYVKGQPRPYIRSHQCRLSPVEYIEEDRGYKTPCWIWQRATTFGYGRMWHNGSTSPVPAHRVIYERHKGPIPEGLVLDHLCRIPSCVNPDHLEPVTNAVNTQRGLQSKLTEDEVRAMRKMHTEGVTYADLGRLFKVAWQSCRQACLRESWADLD
jgi:hypothetical protein